MAGKTLADAIAFNEAHAAKEMPYFGQEIFELAESLDISSPDAPQAAFGGLTYNQALDIDQAAGATNGIDAALSAFNIERHRHADRHAGVDDRPDQRRSLHVRHVGARRHRRLPDHQRADGQCLRAAGRHQLHRHRLQRADADQAGRGLRARHARARSSHSCSRAAAQECEWRAAQAAPRAERQAAAALASPQHVAMAIASGGQSHLLYRSSRRQNRRTER